MTPEEQHRDAVMAAREWRDEQRTVWVDSGSGPGYVVPAAQVSNLGHLPEPGTCVTIRQPGGHDWKILFRNVPEDFPAARPGWVWLRGLVVEPNRPELRVVRVFHCRPLGDGTYEMTPKLN